MSLLHRTLTKRFTPYHPKFTLSIMPFPDWYVIKPNVEFFIQNGVRGIFQEGVYGTTGGDMAGV